MTEQPSILLNDGARMPQLGLGVWQTSRDEAAGVVRTAIELGYRSIDTARVYQNERAVGEGLRAAGRDDVFLTTKLWNDDQGYDPALKAFDASLERLGRESVDLYLIHWRALVRLKEEGRARSIGVSNFAPEHLERIIGETGVTPAVNQVELHPAFQQRPLRDAHARLGVATTSWSPLGQGGLVTDATLAHIAAKHGRTPAQVIIRWHLDNGLIVIPKTVRTERLRENLDVFGFTLDAEDLARIGALDRPDGRIGPDPLVFVE
jgi:2,5-diketo-D-gluconate reductase A